MFLSVVDHDTITTTAHTTDMGTTTVLFITTTHTDRDITETAAHDSSHQDTYLLTHGTTPATGITNQPPFVVTVTITITNLPVTTTTAQDTSITIIID